MPLDGFGGAAIRVYVLRLADGCTRPASGSPYVEMALQHALQIIPDPLRGTRGAWVERITQLHFAMDLAHKHPDHAGALFGPGLPCTDSLKPGSDLETSLIALEVRGWVARGFGFHHHFPARVEPRCSSARRSHDRLRIHDVPASARE